MMYEVVIKGNIFSIERIIKKTKNLKHLQEKTPNENVQTVVIKYLAFNHFQLNYIWKLSLPHP